MHYMIKVKYKKQEKSKPELTVPFMAIYPNGDHFVYLKRESTKEIFILEVEKGVMFKSNYHRIKELIKVLPENVMITSDITIEYSESYFIKDCIIKEE